MMYLISFRDRPVGLFPNMTMIHDKGAVYTLTEVTIMIKAMRNGNNAACLLILHQNKSFLCHIAPGGLARYCPIRVSPN